MFKRNDKIERLLKSFEHNKTALDDLNYEQLTTVLDYIEEYKKFLIINKGE